MADQGIPGQPEQGLPVRRSGLWQLAGGVANFITGAFSIAWGRSNRVSGDSSVAIGSGNDIRFSSNSVAIGTNNTITGVGSFCHGASHNVQGTNVATFGSSNTPTGINSLAFGSACTTTGGYSLSGGQSCTTAGQFGMAFGSLASAYLQGMRSFASGQIAAQGDAQDSYLVLRNAITTSTSTNVFLDGASARAVLTNNTLWSCTIKITAKSTVATGLFAVFNRNVSIIRGATAAATALVGSVQTIGTDVGSNAGVPPVGWSVSITADATNGALDIQVVGDATNQINWVATVNINQNVKA